jgi:hypothetical protein
MTGLRSQHYISVLVYLDLHVLDRYLKAPSEDCVVCGDLQNLLLQPKERKLPPLRINVAFGLQKSLINSKAMSSSRVVTRLTKSKPKSATCCNLVECTILYSCYWAPLEAVLLLLITAAACKIASGRYISNSINLSIDFSLRSAFFDIRHVSSCRALALLLSFSSKILVGVKSKVAFLLRVVKRILPLLLCGR